MSRPHRELRMQIRYHELMAEFLRACIRIADEPTVPISVVRDVLDAAGIPPEPPKPP